MKAILICVSLIFFCLLHSQNKDQVIPDSLQRHYYNVSFPRISPNEQYITFNKAYDRSSDTVVLINRNNRDSVIFESGKVLANSINFTSNNNLMMRHGKNFQLLILPSLHMKVWENVTNYYWLPHDKLIFILQDRKLKILNENGEENSLINDVIGVNKIDDVLYFVTEDDKKNYSLYEWNLKQNKKIYSSPNSKMEVKYRDQDGLFILEQDENKKKALLIYRSSKDDKLFLCNDFIDSVNFSQISKLNDGKYFIHFFPELKSKSKDEVEVWYGNDNKIQTKFYNDYIGKYFIWSPKEEYSCEILNERLTHHAFIGNNRYLLSFDPYYQHDYTKRFQTFNLHTYDTLLDKYDFMIDSGSMVFSDDNGKWILTYQNKEKWILYEVGTLNFYEIQLDTHENAYFSKDGKRILFEGMGELFEYDIQKKKLNKFPLKSGFRAKIKNGTMQNVSSSYNIYRSSYDSSNPVIIELYDRDNVKNAWMSFNGKMAKDIIKVTDDDITSVDWSGGMKKLLYVKSNINKPPQLILKKHQKEEIVYESNSLDKEAKNIFSKTILYKNSQGQSLQGILLYPVNFKEGKQYPMIVTIYQKLRYMKNKYLVDGIGMNPPTEGINVRKLLRKGYFVYMPDVVFDSRGTGRSALDCVTSAMNALQGYSFIDFKKVALIGHSHGGYETNFIATQSNLFATYISGAGNSDLVRSYHSFNYNFNRPFFWQFEDGQYEMPGSFVENKMIYIDNSPIYHAEMVQKPILLWTGKKDYNIFWEQTMEFYLGLRRNHKKVVALFYPNDEHSLSKNNNRIDLYSRISDWLDFYLKNKSVKWIDKMME
ncbi:alpha/beta hydrolase family protein [Chryseobacterium vrystaatense]|uniref:Prolyl oligopeptidase family protein n=1 Tax=Chryseobacterium vrystaatense TaxID=307480 RepID=A0A1M5GWG6_9FLAO|nr:prolyl oligopeptidase family serine peptidase [Chryseobacterium vrystaatense]SHG08038.1 Prolyl oligopeptidase family protein [Chryseobacterium vrystaatense]